MPLWLFLFCSTVGSMLWIIFLTSIGKSSVGILDSIESLGSGMVVLLVLVAVVFWWRRREKKRAGL
jgi:membrane protein DedA with SNARE-associated domain